MAGKILATTASPAGPLAGAPHEDIVGAREGPVATIAINRPERRNACRFQTLDELIDAFERCADDPAIRAVILTGAGGRAFSAGADLKEVAEIGEGARIGAGIRKWGRLARTIETLPKPVIAGVAGYALGGGTEIAIACHIRIAARSARFGLSEILRGHIPGAGGTVRFPRLIGEGPGLYHLLTGEQIPADEARVLGLVSKVVPDERLLPACMEVARHLAGLSPVALDAIIRAVMHGRDASLDAALALEWSLCQELRDSRDNREGLRAFVEKRPPRYGQMPDRATAMKETTEED